MGILEMIGLGLQVLNSLGSLWGANKAEKAAEERAAAMRQLGQEALAKTDMSNIAGSMAQKAVGRIGGALAGQGTFGSSLANQTYQGVLSDVLSRLAPAQQQGMLQAYQMMMRPEELMLQTYANAGQEAAGGSDMDLSFLSWLPNMFSKSPGQAMTSSSGIAGSDFKFGG